MKICACLASCRSLIQCAHMHKHTGSAVASKHDPLLQFSVSQRPTLCQICPANVLGAVTLALLYYARYPFSYSAGATRSHSSKYAGTSFGSMPSLEMCIAYSCTHVQSQDNLTQGMLRMAKALRSLHKHMRRLMGLLCATKSGQSLLFTLNTGAV